MGYVFVTSPCANCHTVFSYNPVRVPSVRVNGSRQPVCLACMDRLNRKRIEAGLPEIAIFPDAYGPVDEYEVPWND